MFQSSAFRPQIAAALAVLYSALYPHGMLYDERPWGNFTVLDEAANRKASADAEIGAGGSPVHVLVITAREDLEIAREVRNTLTD